MLALAIFRAVYVLRSPSAGPSHEQKVLGRGLQTEYGASYLGIVNIEVKSTNWFYLQEYRSEKCESASVNKALKVSEICEHTR